MEKTQITSDKAPKAVGPYSQAIYLGNFIFCSGQIGIDPKTQELVEGGIEAQARQVLENLSQVLNSAGASLENVVKTEIFIKDMEDFAKVNEIYGNFFNSDPKPARVTVEVSSLPKNALIEISLTAFLEK